MNLALDGCLAKLMRAEVQIADAERRFRAYTKNCCRLVRKNDSRAKQIIFTVLKFKEPPVLFALLIGEILHNLRCPLDYLVSENIRASGGTVAYRHSFPICETFADFKRAIGYKLVGLEQPQIDAIDRLQPYHAGNPHEHPLGLLARFNNTDKHRLLSVCHSPPYHLTTFHEGQDVEVASVTKVKQPNVGDVMVTYNVISEVRPSQVEVKPGFAFDVFIRQTEVKPVLFPVVRTLRGILGFLDQEVFQSKDLIGTYQWGGDRFPVIAPWDKLIIPSQSRVQAY